MHRIRLSLPPQQKSKLSQIRAMPKSAQLFAPRRSHSTCSNFVTREDAVIDQENRTVCATLSHVRFRSVMLIFAATAIRGDVGAQSTEQIHGADRTMKDGILNFT
jgi:hypothetical protein